ncbi:MAG: T9SS type A sorting domain-containing protein [Bacteroidetes bacterium]|nr:T9SS type A sorting domain-containing protein [Bacteroidota bacterium]
MKKFAVILLFSLLSGGVCAQTWTSPGIYTSYAPSAIKKWKGEIYVTDMASDSHGNAYTQSMFCRHNSIGWDWMGLTVIGPLCLEIFSDTMFIGGYGGFSSPLYPNWPAFVLLPFDGDTIHFFIESPGDKVEALCKFQGNLYIGGRFVEGHDSLGNIDTVNRIIYFDGKHTHKLGSGISCPNGEIYSMTVYNNKLFVGGYFYRAGGMLTYAIASWDGEKWEKVPENPFGISNAVFGFAVDSINNFLYTCLDYALWKFNGHWWELVGGQYYNLTFSKLIFYHKELYVSTGDNFIVDSMNFGRAVRWTGSQWQMIGQQVIGGVNSFEIIDDTLWVGGVRFNDMYNLGKWHTPQPAHCDWLQPEIYIDTDTLINLNDSGIVRFENNNAYADSWHWDFGDGNYDSIQNPTHIFSNAGDFMVSVSVSMDGCVKTASMSMHVTSLPEEKATETPYLGQNQPNPHNGTTVIPYKIQPGSKAFLQITNNGGELAKEYVLKANENQITIHIRGFAPGIYFYSLVVNGQVVETKKMVVE